MQKRFIYYCRFSSHVNRTDLDRANVVGVEWVLLKWMNKLSGLTGFLIKLVMIIAGIIIIYLNKADWKNE
ncbi:MAG: hypothetical protein HWD63_07195 [Candidatus Parvibacillus calidus]|nr:MAG: hypothetical protein HWD63_07195 [Candidatus Parvibacillus calidus]